MWLRTDLSNFITFFTNRLVPLQEPPSLRFSGPSAGSLTCSLRAASKLAPLKQSTLLFLTFAEASNASKPIFRSGTPTPSASGLG